MRWESIDLRMSEPVPAEWTPPKNRQDTGLAGKNGDEHELARCCPKRQFWINMPENQSIERAAHPGEEARHDEILRITRLAEAPRYSTRISLSLTLSDKSPRTDPK